MLLDFYQHIPEYINPIAFSVGFFSIRWYSLMLIVGIATVYLLLNFSKQEILVGENQKSKLPEGQVYGAGKNQNHPKAEQARYGAGKSKFKTLNFNLDRLFFYLLIGILIGGRLGYVLFYDLTYFIQNPLEIFLPIQVVGCLPAGEAGKLLVVGYYGMSYHGGLIGVILAGIIFARKYKINFWKLADWVIPAVPAGYFLGRIGNFLNGELYGRLTDMPWGMYFNGQLRHPSQLYEAFFEGIILFIILWALRGKSKFPGYLFSVYLFGYGLFRFVLEFFREPDAQIGFIFSFLTMGQILSIGMMFLSLIIFRLARSSDS